ncbi:MAG: hypothetical protein MUE41_11600 [Gemmatimonadaceae bacterium]|nr:hypothetical protein [Gemmatimonadaceae bacterium]
MRLSLAALRGIVVLGAEPPPPAVAPRARIVGGVSMKGVPLTPEQQARVREIHRRFAAERAAIAAQAPGRGGADPELRAKIFANVDRMLEEQRAVLTAEQRVRYDQNVAEIHASRAKLFGP